MNFIDTLTNLKNRLSRPNSAGPVAVVHWDRENIFYLIVKSRSMVLRDGDFGVVNHTGFSNPFLALSKHFEERAIRAQRLVAILSRPELDLPTLNLPPAENDELPGLIASEVEQQLGETDEPPIVDFHVIENPQADKSAGIQVLAFALPAKELHSLQKQVNLAKFRLSAICSRHMAPLGVLRRCNISEDRLAVVVHLYAGEVELALCRGTKPLLLRTIRTSNDESVRVAEQIWMETQRCLTLLSHETAEMKHSWYVFVSTQAAREVANALHELGKLEIETIDPLLGWDYQPSQEVGDESIPSATAANCGAAWDYLHNQLTINLLAPKQPPKPTNPMVRWAAMGVAAASVLGLGIHFLLSDVEKLRDEAQALERDLEGERKVTTKVQEKADQVLAVEAWLSDSVDWLSELNDLSNRLPDGQDASVRRLTAVVNSKAVTIDLSVQVVDQEFISRLESKIRSEKYSVASKQISQNAESTEYPWQFETRVSFAATPPLPSKYGPYIAAKTDEIRDRTDTLHTQDLQHIGTPKESSK